MKLSAIDRFKRLLQVDKKDITQVYIYAFFNGLVNLSLPIGIQAIINLIQGGEINSSWIILVAFVIGGIALTGVLQLLQLRIVENIAQKIFSRASFEFAYRIPKIKHSELRNYYAPELANRFFDTMTIQKGLPKILIDFSLALFQIVVGLIVLSMYHSFFVLFSFALVGLIYVIIAITGPKGLKTSISESSFKYKIAFWLEEIARSKISFKLISDSDLNLTKSNYHVENYLTARESHFKVLINQSLYLIGFKVIIAAGLLITGSILVFNQEMNIGQFVAAEIIIILIIASVEKLIKSLDSIYDVLTALEKIGYVVDLKLDNDDGGLKVKENTNSLPIVMDRISFQYPDSVRKTLDNIDITIPANTSLIIEGPSNSGKSTLLYIMAGIMEPSQGIIQYRGLPLKSLDKVDLRKYIGFSLSTNEIFQGTIIENIQMGRKNVSAEDIKDALHISRLQGFISSVPLGLNTVLDPEGQKIPRNIKNRILLARAIVNKPKLLILEDPLDHVSSTEKDLIIQELMKGPWTVIVSSVDQLWRKHISNILTLDRGTVTSYKLDNRDA
jgi:ABC-type bacteriocin/lantibiotic exporter with double-glycine peptidase domain